MARILVVDDEQVFLEALSEAIKLRGGELVIDTALDAGQGLARLESVDYDVIICDYRMPGMDGMEFLRRARARRPDSPVVMITGYGDPEVEAKALTLGAYAFIHKPFVVDVFFSVLRRAILRSKLLHRQSAFHRTVAPWLAVGIERVSG